MLGSKVRLNVQLAPASSDPLQGGFPDVLPKSALLVPWISAPLKVTVVVPTLYTVTVSETVWPRVTVPKLIEVVENLMPVPTPCNAAVCGLVTSVSAMLSVPDANPTTVGLKSTFTKHVASLASTRLFVQVVLDALANGPVTVTAGLLRVIDTPVLLVRVTLVVPLVNPTAVVANVTEVGLKVTLLMPVPETPTS